MKDRLAEFRGIQQELPPEYEETDLEAMDTNQRSPFDDFFKQIDEIQQNMYGIQEHIQEIKKLHSDILSAPNPDERVKEQLEQYQVDVKRSADRIKLNLKSMQSGIDEQEKANRGNYADLRIRKCQHAALSREFVEIMTEYNNIQNEHREKCKNRIKRQLHIVDKTYDDDTLEDMIESGNPAIFQQDIIMETQQAKQSLREIEARHNDIINLEKSIKELHEIFIDMAILVQSQGEMIDRIEYNVEHAAEYVQRAVKDTKKAVVYQSKARRKKIIIVIVCIIILLIIAIAIYFSVK